MRASGLRLACITNKPGRFVPPLRLGSIALELGKPNANAARSLVVRALYKLYEEMSHDA